MTRHEVHTLTEEAGFSSMKEKLSKKVALFLDKKTNEGYSIVNISFTYFEARKLVAFITICK